MNGWEGLVDWLVVLGDWISRLPGVNRVMALL